MENEGAASPHKHNIWVYVIIGVAVIGVIYLLLGSGSSSGSSGGIVAGPNPQAVGAYENAQAASSVASTNAIVAKAQIAAEQNVALVTAKDELRLGLAQTAAAVEVQRLNANSQLEVVKAEQNGGKQNYTLAQIVEGLLANMNFGGVAPSYQYSGAAPSGYQYPGGGSPGGYGGYLLGGGGANGGYYA